MKKQTVTTICALLALLPSAPAQTAGNSAVPQGDPQQQMKTDNLPAWLVEFSNLPRQDREKYLQGFGRAKQFFQKGDWHSCILEITNCEIIFNQNPNSWNLRLSCMIELKDLEHADEYLERVRKAIPNDPVTLLNIANLHLVRGEYQQCITEMNNIIRTLPYDTDGELVNIMRFRIMLSHLMLGNESQAAAILQGLTALDDTPLFYYGHAALNIYHGKRQEAMMDVNSANNIFAKNQATIPYQRGITASGLIDKYLPEVNKEKNAAKAAEKK